jgi:hypothetical protein
LAVALIASFAWCVFAYTGDAYFPYGGQVVAIRTSWAKRFILESGDEEILVIRTPDGKMIDRVVSMQTRILQGIRVGDHVVKERGFGNSVRRAEAE